MGFLDENGLSRVWQNPRQRLKPVAFSGSYNDLDDRPDIPAAGLTEEQVRSTIASIVNGGCLKLDWKLTALPSRSTWRSVTYGDDKFVAVVSNSDKAAYSTDGINWTAVMLPLPGNWYSVAYGNGKFVAVSGSNGTKSAYSIG